jgi:hypothetical protein
MSPGTKHWIRRAEDGDESAPARFAALCVAEIALLIHHVATTTAEIAALSEDAADRFARSRQ